MTTFLTIVSPYRKRVKLLFKDSVDYKRTRFPTSLYLSGCEDIIQRYVSQESEISTIGDPNTVTASVNRVLKPVLLLEIRENYITI